MKLLDISFSGSVVILPQCLAKKVCATSTITFTPSAKVNPSVPPPEVTKPTSAHQLHHTSTPPVKNQSATNTTSSSSHLDEPEAAHLNDSQDKNLSDKVNLFSNHAAEEHNNRLPTVSSNKKLSINPTTTHQNYQPKEAQGQVITTSNNSIINNKTTTTNLDTFGNNSSAGAWVSLALKMSNRQSHSRRAQDAGYGGGGVGEVESGLRTAKHSQHQ